MPMADPKAPFAERILCYFKFQLHLSIRNISVKKYLLFFLFQMILLAASMAQQFQGITFDSYSSEIFSYRRGLSQNTVNCILQDSRGFLWIGTWDGLNRFDGYDFISYKPDYDHPKGNISNESINALAEDRSGNIWVGTDKGLNYLNFQTDTFATFFYSFYNQNSLPSDSISALCVDRTGRLWIGTNRGLCSYDPDRKAFRSFVFHPRRENTIPSDRITELYLDSRGQLWIGTSQGLACMNTTTGIIKRISVGNPKNPACQLIFSVFEYNKQIWVSSGCGLYLFSEQTLNAVPLPFDEIRKDNLIVSCMLSDFQGNLWLGTANDGLHIYNVAERKLIHIYSEYGSRYGLSNNSVLSLLKTDAGEVWVGTWHGLNKFSPYTFKFPQYRVVGQHFGNAGNLIWSFIQYNNEHLLVGTDEGLVRFNLETSEMSQFAESAIGHTPVRALHLAGNGDLWVGTFQDGLYRLSPEGGIIRHYLNSDSCGLPDNTIWKIAPQGDRYLWLATYGGLGRLDLKTGCCRNWKSRGFESASEISNNTVNHVLVDRSGIVWTSTFGGLNRLDPKTGRVYVFHYDKGNPNTISNERVLSTFEDSKGILWIGTMGGGLNRYDRNSGLITRFSTKNGLPDNVIYDIIEDRMGYLWLTSNKGLIRFNPSSRAVTAYDINDGVQSQEFNLGAAYLLPDGKIAVGGMNGFNLFDPENIKTNRKIPRIVITGFEVFNNKYGSYINDGDTIILEPHNNFFSISFAALDFVNPGKNQYKYKLHNYDKDWVSVDARRRQADYTDVKPGTYVFQVIASNSDGVWNEEGVSFVIVVKPPFYQTWFFRLSLLGVIIFITWLFIRGRVNKVRKQNEVEATMLRIEKQMFDLEQKALRLQMNPHFIFNSLNSIQSFVLLNDTEKAINYLAKFSQLMRLILTTSRESFISVAQEVSLLKYYIDLENMRFNNRFNFEINLDSNIDTEFTGIPPMIIQPYVENAILHGLMNKREGECRLTVQMWQKEDYILCVIEDNGIGRDRARQIKEQSGLSQKSQGIIITKERLDILNTQLKNKISVEINDLRNEVVMATWTRVRLVIPFTEM